MEKSSFRIFKFLISHIHFIIDNITFGLSIDQSRLTTQPLPNNFVNRV